MLKSTSMLLDEFSAYQDPFGKISRLCEKGNLHQLTRGIYETDGSTPGYTLAPVLYGPSYLSFDYALSQHGLIPEAVHEYTSATCGKGKKKQYHNDFGDYSYRDVPVSAFPFETKLITENGYTYSLATPEKALCDKLYTLSPIKNLTELRELLLINLRIDEDELKNLNAETIDELSRFYKCNNIRFLSKFLRRL